MRFRFRSFLVFLVAIPGFFLAGCVAAQESKPAPAAKAAPLDPAAWGEDHVGKELPEYITGDECLFCHRLDIGPKWPTNPHGRTIRMAEAGKPPLDTVEQTGSLKQIAAETAFVMGRSNLQRLLKAGEGYGRFDIATVAVKPAGESRPAAVVGEANAGWDHEKFGKNCAGCHATAVSTESMGFAASSLDCYACHGSVSLQHTTDTKLMMLSKKRQDPAEKIASICGQCHLREGKSRSTGRPYPNQFVAGDNLFKDFQVDFSDEHIAKMDAGDRHVYQNIKDIVVSGETGVTCLTCHEVHAASSEKHLAVKKSESCFICHIAGERLSRNVKLHELHSGVCEY